MADKKPRLTKRDFDAVSEADKEELAIRKDSENRRTLEKQWDQVDRQIELDKAEKNKILPDWFPETPIPNQANALEVLGADVDRLQFPDSKQFFSVNAEMSTDYLDSVRSDIDFMGRDIEEEALVDQEDINAITQAALIHAHKQYNFEDHIAQMDAEALRYGTYCCRLRPALRYSFTNDFRGISKTVDKLPAVLPISIRNVYLDDKSAKAINSGMLMGSREFVCFTQHEKDIKMASAKGTSDTGDMAGGWRKAEVANLEAPKKDGQIEVFEVEGDMIVPRKSGEDLYFPNMIVTHATGKKGPVVIRIRENKLPFNSLMHGTYFKEKIGVYGKSPLMKGAPIQSAAEDMLNVMLATGWMNAGPPVGWNRNDLQLRAEGGPQFHPYALWDSMSEIIVHKDLGSISDARDAYLALVKQYEEVTGVSSPRTGAQTKSHQTAYAVDTEVNRGQARTVNFVRAKSRGVMTNILNGELEILRRDMPKQSIYVPKFKGYVTMSKKSIPKNATFTIAGSSNPAEQQQQDQAKIAILTNLVQLEASGAIEQLGGKPLDVDKVREEMLQIGVPEADVASYFKEVQQAPPQAQQALSGPTPGGNLPGDVQQIAQNIGFEDVG